MKHLITRSVLLSAPLALLLACAHQPVHRAAAPALIQTRESQSATTPADALARLKAGNVRFVAGRSLNRDLPAERARTVVGQYPFAAIVSCIDSRTSSELIFDLGLGDAFNARVAGNVVNDDTLGGLEFATKVAGAKLVAVVGHTRCGAVAGACDHVELGHLTGLLGKIQPAVEQTEPEPGHARSGKDYGYVDRVAENHVRLVMRSIRDQSPVLRELIEGGHLGLAGGIYDLSTGQVRFLEERAVVGDTR